MIKELYIFHSPIILSSDNYFRAKGGPASTAQYFFNDTSAN